MPPCTTTGRNPAKFRNSTSEAKDSCSLGSVIALPPYLTTTIAPRFVLSSQGVAAAMFFGRLPVGSARGQHDGVGYRAGHVAYAEFSCT